MKKADAQKILGDLADLWPRLNDQRKQMIWDNQLSREMKEAIYELYRREGLPLAVAAKLDKPAAPTAASEPPPPPAPEWVDLEPGPETLLAELTAYDRLTHPLLIRPNVHPLMTLVERCYPFADPAESIVETIEQEDTSHEPQAVTPPGGAGDGPPVISPEMMTQLRGYTIQEAVMMKESQRTWQSLAVSLFVLCLCAWGLLKVLGLQ